MQFNLDMDEVESVKGIGEPPPTGTYLFVCVECEGFQADSGTQGVNTAIRIVGTKEPDTEKHHGKYARPTFWLTQKAAKFFKGWADTVGLPYTSNGFNEADALGKVFWGRIRSYQDENGYDKQDLQRWEEAKEEDRSIASAFIAQWLGEDKPPSDMGKGVNVGAGSKRNKDSGDDNGEVDDDVPF